MTHYIKVIDDQCFSKMREALTTSEWIKARENLDKTSNDGKEHVVHEVISDRVRYRMQTLKTLTANKGVQESNANMLSMFDKIDPCVHVLVSFCDKYN